MVCTVVIAGDLNNGLYVQYVPSGKVWRDGRWAGSRCELRVPEEVPARCSYYGASFARAVAVNHRVMIAFTSRSFIMDQPIPKNVPAIFIRPGMLVVPK